jgi:hypothetical protein
MVHQIKQGRRHRRWPIALVATGVVLVGASIGWKHVAVPALVRFPTDVDQNVNFAGTATLYVDPSSMEPYAQPRVLPLQATRHVVAVGAESDHDTVVLREENTIGVGSLPVSQQVHQYVIDRVSLANLADPRAWAYETTNVLDRAGAFWLSFPMNAGDATSYPMYKDEVGRTIASVSDPAVAEAAGQPRGLRLIGFSVALDSGPITEAYQKALGQTVPLPEAVTLSQLDPILKANGVDVQTTLAALLPVLTPAELQILTTLAAQPINLVYTTAFSGSTAVEPRTGAIVNVTAIEENVAVSPDPGALPPLVAVLQKHADIPEVAAAISGLERLSGQPVTLLHYRYAQTPASVLDVASTVKDSLDQIRMVETTIPWTTSVVGGILIGIGALLLIVRRRPSAAPVVPTAVLTEPVKHDVEPSEHVPTPV